MKSIIKAISYYLPEKVLDNKELDKNFPEWKIDDLAKVTGVYQRHIASEGEISSDMAFIAAEQLFDEHNIDRKDVDFILFCSQSTDYLSPTTACILQDRLNIPNTTGANDYNQGCTGFVYGLSYAKALIESNQAKNVLLLTSETLSKYLYPKDKSVIPLFGDAATATLICATEEKMQKGIGNFVFGTDGKGYKNIINKFGGARFPVADESSNVEFTDKYGNIRIENSFYMNGSSVFLFSIKRGPKLVQDVLDKTGNTIEDIDMFVFHQASRFILETISKKMSIPEEKLYIYLEKCGNTVSSSIPIALYNAEKDGKVKRGDKLAIISFGVGYSWAGTVVDY